MNGRITDDEDLASIPDQLAGPHRSTGTVDDDDEPEDEQDGENEASERETNDSTELPEELDGKKEHAV